MNEILQKLANLVADKIRITGNDQLSSKETFELKYFTVSEVCELLHISRSTLYRHRKLGLIVPSAFAGRRVLFTRSDIDSYARKQTEF